MSDLLDLAARVEALTASDRKVDVAVALVLTDQFFNAGPKYDGAPDRIGILRDGESVVPGNGAADRFVPQYTASLDAAMTLIPEGWAISALSMWPASPEGADKPSQPQASVNLLGTSLKRFGREIVWGHGGGKDGKAKADAATPALALTTACLRAIARLKAEAEV